MTLYEFTALDQRNQTISVAVCGKYLGMREGNGGHRLLLWDMGTFYVEELMEPTPDKKYQSTGILVAFDLTNPRVDRILDRLVGPVAQLIA